MENLQLLKMMMENDHYGQKLEHAFKNIFEGNKLPFKNCCQSMIDVLEASVKKGYLTFKTFTYLKNILIDDHFYEDRKIISSNTDLVTILNIETEESFCFELSDLVSAFVSELSKDPLFQRQLKGHYDYSGIINALETLSLSRSEMSVDLSNAIDAAACENTMYLTEQDDGFKLFRIEMNLPEQNVFPEKKFVTELRTPDIFCDPDKKCIYVNHADGFGREILFKNGKETTFDGTIVGLSEQGDLIKVLGKDLLIISNGEYTKIGHKNSIFLDINDSEAVRWIDCSGDELQFYQYRNRKISTSQTLKKRVIWSYIIMHGYDLKYYTDKTTAHWLWVHKMCQVPLPFSTQNVQSSISYIEKGIFSNYVEKSAFYEETLSALLMQEYNGEIEDVLFRYYSIQRYNVCSIDILILGHICCILFAWNQLLNNRINPWFKNMVGLKKTEKEELKKAHSEKSDKKKKKKKRKNNKKLLKSGGSQL